MVLILVEGADKMGKTTLCETLSKMTGIPVYKSKAPSKLALQGVSDKAISDMQDFMRKWKNESYIFDRFFVSELVYASVFKRKTQEYYVLSCLNQLKYQLIIIYVEAKDYKERFKTEEKMSMKKCLATLREYRKWYWYLKRSNYIIYKVVT